MFYKYCPACPICGIASSNGHMLILQQVKLSLAPLTHLEGSPFRAGYEMGSVKQGHNYTPVKINNIKGQVNFQEPLGPEGTQGCSIAFPLEFKGHKTWPASGLQHSQRIALLCKLHGAFDISRRPPAPPFYRIPLKVEGDGSKSTLECIRVNGRLVRDSDFQVTLFFTLIFVFSFLIGWGAGHIT